MEVLGGLAPGRMPEEALDWLAGRADIAVVTLGERGECCSVQQMSAVAVQGARRPTTKQHGTDADAVPCRCNQGKSKRGKCTADSPQK